MRPWLVLDEGGPIVTGQIPGVDGPVALVGVSEKLSVKVRCACIQPMLLLSANECNVDCESADLASMRAVGGTRRCLLR